MNVAGNPADWADLLDPLVPDILRLVVDTWESMAVPAADEKEDTITVAVCRALRQNRTARDLPVQIQTQQVELDPNPGEDTGRLDIVFNVLVPREDIYFCLEGKRLNVVKDGVTRAYASEYVRLGMMRFVTGQYSRAVRHGGMIGYVMDGKINPAIENVATNIQSQCSELRMTPPGTLLASNLMNGDGRARETHHRRDHEANTFRIHHLFMSVS